MGRGDISVRGVLVRGWKGADGGSKSIFGRGVDDKGSNDAGYQCRAIGDTDIEVGEWAAVLFSCVQNWQVKLCDANMGIKKKVLQREQLDVGESMTWGRQRRQIDFWKACRR